MSDTLWKFIDNNATFVAYNPHRITRLYFPLCHETGLMSSITPNLSGDIKRDQHSFLTPPMCSEDLHNSRYSRNFWLYLENGCILSMNSTHVDECFVEAGMLWHKATKIHKKRGISIETLNFMPINEGSIELMCVQIKNISGKKIALTPTAAIPIYGRSADRIRDHRHVSALLNRITINPYGIIVAPTMSFDERGHNINKTSYFVLGCDSHGKAPIGSFPTMLEFAGEGNNLDNPGSVLKNLQPSSKPPLYRQGKEAIGALRFKKIVLALQSSAGYIIAMGITDTKNPLDIFKKFNSPQKIERSFSKTKKFWVEKISSLSFSTGNTDFDRWMKWVSLQPALRKTFGCSFLPDFDYGRGGRGWRDLWQDCLTLVLVSPREAHPLFINNFGGVRTDGSNATIIGKRPGEFISDRNNISRTWMDHGLWPFMTLNLYINQTGDTDILFEKAPYFESTKTGTILDHVIRQHQRPFTKIGPHGNFLLEGADWNDGLDMAKDKGESVAFTSAYIGNFTALADLLEKINYKKDVINDLRKKAHALSEHIRRDEWLTVKSGHSFFNGYYDNLSRRVEGDHKNGVRMTLTGQVFPIMSGVATDSQIKEIWKSAKKYLWDQKLKGFRLNTDFGGTQPHLGRAFGFAYGEKENGAFFSHMNVMFAYSLYKRNFVAEGFGVLDSLYKMCLNTELSKMYPGIPEYFNSDGRGMYHYLTGSASWFMFTMLTQVFGVRGVMGNLLLKPKLVKEQFSKSPILSVNTNFANKKIRVAYINPKKLDYSGYKIGSVKINGKNVSEMPIKKETLLKYASNPTNAIDVELVPL